MSLKYKVGQKVTVKRFKKFPFHWMYDMKLCCGKIVTIKKINNGEFPYEINGSVWLWKHSDFENIELLEDSLFEI